MNIQEQIISEILSFCARGTKIKLENKLYDDLMLDSFDRIELEINIEKKFNIDLTDDSFNVDKNITVQEVIDLITKKLEETDK